MSIDLVEKAVEKSKMCCLLIHGFGGGIDEVRPLAQALKEGGIPVYTTTLAGHRGPYQDFFMSNRTQWIVSARRCVAQLSKKYEEIVIVGFSMGGLIATCMSDYPIKAIIFANTPMFFCDYNQILKNFYQGFWQYSKKYLSAAIKTPPTALNELYALLGQVKNRGFDRVKCPVLILQSRDDDTAHVNSAAYLAKEISSTKSVKYFENGGHKIFCGPCSEAACSAVLDFIKTCD